MTPRHAFDRGLDELHTELLKMAGLVEESIDNAILALKKQDIEMARQVFRNDDIIDDYERIIEKKCMNLIARQQPLAKDLRTIGTALKIITDLERIADASADISEITIRMAGKKYIKRLVDIPKMAEKAKIMVKKSIDAYVRQDIKLAEEVCASDDDVDELFNKIIFELINIMKNDPGAVEQGIDFMFIAKYLERMADHATNIGEWVSFNITGEHERLARLYHREGGHVPPYGGGESGGNGDGAGTSGDANPADKADAAGGTSNGISCDGASATGSSGGTGGASATGEGKGKDDKTPTISHGNAGAVVGDFGGIGADGGTGDGASATGVNSMIGGGTGGASATGSSGGTGGASATGGNSAIVADE